MMNTEDLKEFLRTLNSTEKELDTRVYLCDEDRMFDTGFVRGMKRSFELLVGPEYRLVLNDKTDAYDIYKKLI